MEKKLKKLRTSRNKKTYWRKGPQLADVEQFLHDESVDQSEGGVLRERTDSDLFTLDRERLEPSGGPLTRRQSAALNRSKILQNAESVPDEDIKPTKQEIKKIFARKKTNKFLLDSKIKHEEGDSKSSALIGPPSKQPYDLWAAEVKTEKPSKELELIEDHYLRSTKRRQPRPPSTTKHLPSLLPAIEVAEAGASYNPTVSNYLNYLNNIAKEEDNLQNEEKKLQDALKLAPGQSYVSQAEIIAEQSAGLFEDPSASVDDDQADKDPSIDTLSTTKKAVIAKRKTTKKRRREALEKKKKLLEEAQKEVKNAEQQIFIVKKINKQISKQLLSTDEKARKRRKQKITKKLLGTQQLGRGKFTPEERPFLLSYELSASLRELKPQGDILADRLKSLQKRNMMPVPGDGQRRSKLKRKLRFKESERRSNKEVTLGSRVR